MSGLDDGPVAFLGDAHLRPGDETAGALAEFVAGAAGRLARLVLVGDIFDLWFARPHLHQEHHRRVLDAVAEARARGLAVDYVVGNRDFGLETWAEAPFDRVATERLDDPAPAPAWAAEHGDLVNEDDRSYRRFRAIMRSRPVLGAFLGLPAALCHPLTEAMERQGRGMNLDQKQRFPEEHLRRRGARQLAETGARWWVVGHLHVEARLGCPGGEVIVLPAWHGARRHALYEPGRGELRFEDSARYR